MKTATFLLALAVGSGAATAAADPPALTIEEVVARHDELDGQGIRVRGWLTACEPLSCRISAGPNRQDRPHLSIGGSETFDAAVENLIGRQIVLDATLDPKCLHIQVDDPPPEGKAFICTDRAPVLANPALVASLPD